MLDFLHLLRCGEKTELVLQTAGLSTFFELDRVFVFPLISVFHSITCFALKTFMVRDTVPFRKFCAGKKNRESFIASIGKKGIFSVKMRCVFGCCVTNWKLSSCINQIYHAVIGLCMQQS